MSKELVLTIKFGGLLVGLIFLWLMAPFAVVPAGNRGVMTTFGSPSDTVYGEGIHFRIPISQSFHLVNVAVQKATVQSEAASKDLQSVHAEVALNFHISPAKAVYIYRDLSNVPEENIISPSVHEAMKAVAAQFTAEELIAKRQEVRDAIIANLRSRLDRHGIEIDEFSILDFTFSKSFNEAIEAKTTAEQLKLKAVNDLQRIKVEAEQKVVAAKAEADSLALQKQIVTQELLQLRSIENQRAAIEKWNGELPGVTGGTVPFINVQAAK